MVRNLSQIFGIPWVEVNFIIIIIIFYSKIKKKIFKNKIKKNKNFIDFLLEEKN